MMGNKDWICLIPSKWKKLKWRRRNYDVKHSMRSWLYTEKRETTLKFFVGSVETL